MDLAREEFGVRFYDYTKWNASQRLERPDMTTRSASERHSVADIQDLALGERVAVPFFAGVDEPF